MDIKNYRIADAVFERLRESIMNLEYLPGDKLSEAKISEKYEVSRSPVRVAFGLLEQEGFVVIKPQHGTFVAELSNDKIRDILDIRMVLEEYAVGKAVKSISESQLDKLKAIYDDIDKMADGIEKSKLVTETDKDFHFLIWDLCGNSEIVNILQGYKYSIEWVRKLNAQQSKRIEPSAAEMRAVLDGLIHRDVNEARKAMRRHILNIKSDIFIKHVSSLNMPIERSANK